MTTPFLACRRLVASIVVASTILLVAGCAFGPGLEDMPAARPAGANVRVYHGRRRIEGELLSVRDTALVVRAGKRVVLVRWTRVTYLLVVGVEQYQVRGRVPEQTVRERLRLLSRFPQDLTPELERALLATLGRDAIEVDREIDR